MYESESADKSCKDVYMHLKEASPYGDTPAVLRLEAKAASFARRSGRELSTG